MEATHVHLLLNHVPILATLFGIILLSIALLIKNTTLEVTALSLVLVGALVTIPVYLSGEEAEHKVEHMAGISEYELEEHEEHAESVLWIMMATGALALMTLLSYKTSPRLTRSARLATLALGIISFVLLIPLANHGGKIVHSELRESDTAESE